MRKFNVTDLQIWFKSRETLFHHFRKYRLGTRKKRRLFFNNGGDVLLVAHIDTVLPAKLKHITKRTYLAQGLDDRLGCAIGYYLQQFMKVDLLICDYEESARSSAMYHSLKNYNFIIELDREGTDFVTYDLADDDFINDFRDITGCELSWGSFSDICWLDTESGCINVGIGYYKSHSRDSYARKKDVQKQIGRIIQFINECGDYKYCQGYPYNYGTLPLDNSHPKHSNDPACQHCYPQHISECHNCDDYGTTKYIKITECYLCDYQDTDKCQDCYGTTYEKQDYDTQYYDLMKKCEIMEPHLYEDGWSVDDWEDE